MGGMVGRWFWCNEITWKVRTYLLASSGTFSIIGGLKFINHQRFQQVIASHRSQHRQTMPEWHQPIAVRGFWTESWLCLRKRPWCQCTRELRMSAASAEWKMLCEVLGVWTVGRQGRRECRFASTGQRHVWFYTCMHACIHRYIHTYIHIYICIWRSYMYIYTHWHMIQNTEGRSCSEILQYILKLHSSGT